MIDAERRHSWHPFTQMQDWNAPGHEPLILVEGEGALLRDSKGREYIDGNSSIWTNLHGHRHPRINAAIREQLDKVAHTSFLGFTNPPAIQLAEELAALWQRPGVAPELTRVFFSDDGSTAIEAALKMAVQARQQRGEVARTRFVAFANAYHGDTMGASSLGGISTFHGRFSAHQFPVAHVASMDELESGCAGGEPINPDEVTAVVVEPLIQGSAGMQIWPAGMLARLRAWCDRYGVFLIVDEVMTGFGRTGTMFACQSEGVIPDFAALAKGLSGGYLPLAATLVREEIYEAFLGDYSELKSFFYGHSFTANQLGCAAALANLAIFREEKVLERLQGKIAQLGIALKSLENHPNIRNVRQCGFIAAFEVTQASGEPWDWRLQTGARVCEAARKHRLLTRGIRDTLVLMPPYCVSEAQIRQSVEALRLGVEEVAGS
jgi:adenosylmethionine-8-amino-7-oxononanoate aminotransferase